MAPSAVPLLHAAARFHSKQPPPAHCCLLTCPCTCQQLLPPPPGPRLSPNNPPHLRAAACSHTATNAACSAPHPPPSILPLTCALLLAELLHERLPSVRILRPRYAGGHLGAWGCVGVWVCGVVYGMEAEGQQQHQMWQAGEEGQVGDNSSC
jgi:hypothetical protein